MKMGKYVIYVFLLNPGGLIRYKYVYRFVTKAQIAEQIASQSSTKMPSVSPNVAPTKGKKGLNLVIAKDDKELCKEMFGDLYSDEVFASLADENGNISQEQMMAELARLKADVTGTEDVLTAKAAADLFTSKLDTGIAVSCELKQLQGLFGRLISSSNPAAFEKLGGEEGNSFSFVFDYCKLHSLLQCPDGWGMLLKLGITDDELRKKIEDTDLKFKLVIFAGSCVSPAPTLAKWSGLATVLAAKHSEAICNKFAAHCDALASTPYDQLDPEGVIETSADPMSPEAYLEAEDTLPNARKFIKSQFSVDKAFSGLGSSSGFDEHVVCDTAINSIDGAQLVEIAVASPSSS